MPCCITSSVSFSVCRRWGSRRWSCCGVPARARGGALASGACCAAALLCQLLEQARRVRLGDLAAVADTAQAVCAAAGALAVLTLVLNALALYRRR